MINKEALKKSFGKIKQEMNNLKENDEFLQNDINLLRSEVHDKTFIEKIADSIIEKIESRLKHQETSDRIGTQIVEPQQQEIQYLDTPQTQVSRHIDSTLFLKRKIKARITLICKNRVRPSDLKKAIVEVAKLCSKATFYRYISELKREGTIETIEINNELFLLTAEAILDRNIYK